MQVELRLLDPLTNQTAAAAVAEVDALHLWLRWLGVVGKGALWVHRHVAKGC